MTSRRAARSEGYLATGLQKWNGWPAQSSTTSVKWWAVMLQATVSPHFLTCYNPRIGQDRVSNLDGSIAPREGKVGRTASTAAAVVACSSTILSFGKALWILNRCVRNVSSALSTQMPYNEQEAPKRSQISQTVLPRAPEL